MVVYERVILLNTEHTWLHDAFLRYKQRYKRDLMIGKGPCHLFISGLPGDQETLENAMQSPVKTLVICMYREPVGRHMVGFFHHLRKHVPDLFMESNIDLKRHRTLEQQCQMVLSTMENKLKDKDFWELYQPLSAEWRSKDMTAMNNHTDLLWLRFDEEPGYWERSLRKMFPFFQPVVMPAEYQPIQPDVQSLYNFFRRNSKVIQGKLCKALMDGADKSWFEFFYEREQRLIIRKRYQDEADMRSEVAYQTLKRIGVRK